MFRSLKFVVNKSRMSAINVAIPNQTNTCRTRKSRWLSFTIESKNVNFSVSQSVCVLHILPWRSEWSKHLSQAQWCRKQTEHHSIPRATHKCTSKNQHRPTLCCFECGSFIYHCLHICKCNKIELLWCLMLWQLLTSFDTMTTKCQLQPHNFWVKISTSSLLSYLSAFQSSTTSTSPTFQAFLVTAAFCTTALQSIQIFVVIQMSQQLNHKNVHIAAFT